jgi:hypothetical protein
VFHILKQRSTHAGRLERWAGKEWLNQVSQSMAPWYGPDIAMAGIPGAVYARKGGDFVGNIDGGGFSNLLDTAEAAMRAVTRGRSRIFGAGFAGLADLQFEATKALKMRQFNFNKSGQSIAGRFVDHWTTAGQPGAGVAGGAAPGGTVPTDATTGGMLFTNPESGDTQFFVGGETRMDAGGVDRCVLLYDRLFSVAKTMNSTATEAVTGVPTRYQSTTSSDADYAGGNFMFPSTVSALPATAHNWTVCQYTDQDGNTGASAPSIAGVSSAAQWTFDMASPYWFMPLATGDTGVKALTQMQCDALVATGAIDFVLGHPIAWLPTINGHSQIVNDAINSAFQLTRIFDDACLAIVSQNGALGSSSACYGSFRTVAG